jgi:PAS domain S-box-containing protein
LSAPTPSGEALLRQFLDAVPDMLLLGRFDEANQEVVIIAVNETAKTVTGFSEEELIGKVPRSLLMEGAVAPTIEMRRSLAAFARERGVVEYPGEVRLRVPDNGPRLRIRMVWPDPADTLVLVQVEVLKD